MTSGDIRFQLCPVAECPGVETEAEFIAAIRAKQAQGKKVLISIGGAERPGAADHRPAARDAFVSSVSAIIDRYGLDGLDIDFEGHSLSLNAGDTDFRNPTTPVIVNLISALRSLKARYGAGFVLTMAPETFFVQLGYQFYGGAVRRRQPRAGSYLPVIHALRNDLTVLHVQDYNSGPDHGPGQPVPHHGRRRLPHRDDRHAAWPASRSPEHRPTRSRRCARTRSPSALPAAVSAGNGYTAPAAVQQALNCLVRGTELRRLHACAAAPSPAFRGLMTWSINWDRYYNWEFQNSHEPFLNALP